MPKPKKKEEPPPPPKVVTIPTKEPKERSEIAKDKTDTGSRFLKATNQAELPVKLQFLRRLTATSYNGII